VGSAKAERKEEGNRIPYCWAGKRRGTPLEKGTGKGEPFSERMRKKGGGWPRMRGRGKRGNTKRKGNNRKKRGQRKSKRKGGSESPREGKKKRKSGVMEKKGKKGKGGE